MDNLSKLLTFIFVSAMAYSCGPQSTKTEVSDSSEEYVEEEEEEDKSQRPSPPRTTTANISGVNVTIDYSSPAVKGRQIFGDLEAYGKVWRTGANEATVFTNDADIKINGEILPAGQYALFSIPGESEWTIIFNNVPDQWGAYNYDQSKDILRVTVAANKQESVTERLLLSVNPEGVMSFAWENVSWTANIEPATAS
ncbi:MAG: DUF2911 domain-containing protein [Cyclobacteriaceae bacterium]